MKASSGSVYCNVCAIMITVGRVGQTWGVDLLHRNDREKSLDTSYEQTFKKIDQIMVPNGRMGPQWGFYI